MDQVWQFCIAHARELITILLPVILWLLNIAARHILGVLNVSFLGADCAFCAVSISGSCTVRLLAQLVKTSSSQPSGGLLGELEWSFGSTFGWLLVWLVCLGIGLAAHIKKDGIKS